MDHFFEENLQFDALSWYDYEQLHPVNQSAFLPYTSGPINKIWVNNNSGNGSNSVNINKRMIEFMRKSWPAVSIEIQESESERCHFRKMTERLRREKEKEGYSALHSMLPPGTKNDKNSIMQMAAKRIQELNEYKEVLQRRNHELEVKLTALGNGIVKSTKIKFKVVNPASGVDYILEVLRCLNCMGLKIRNIQSSFSNQELVAAMDIETQISDGEIRKAVDSTLQEVERKLFFHFPED